MEIDVANGSLPSTGAIKDSPLRSGQCARLPTQGGAGSRDWRSSVTTPSLGGAVLGATWARNPERFVSRPPEASALPSEIWINPPPAIPVALDGGHEMTPHRVSKSLAGSGKPT